MKKIFYLLMALAIFSGCSNAPANSQPSTTSTTNNKEVTSVNQDILPDNSDTASQQNRGEVEKEPAKPIIVEQPKEIKISEDDNIRMEAVNKLDLAKCGKISEAKIKQSCQLEVISQKLMTDPEYCKTLTDPEHQNICKGLSLTIFPPKS